MESLNDQTALGMVETYGYIAHIEAADACLKAANVRLIGSERVKGGYMLIKVMGDVGAVKAAIDAAKAAVEMLGLKAVTHVIPRPSPDVQKLIHTKPRDDKADNSAVKTLKNDRDDGRKSNNDDSYPDINKLSKMNVAKLRMIARSLENISLDKNQINFGKKQELINAILDCLGKEGRADGDS